MAILMANMKPIASIGKILHVIFALRIPNLETAPLTTIDFSICKRAIPMNIRCINTIRKGNCTCNRAIYVCVVLISNRILACSYIQKQGFFKAMEISEKADVQSIEAWFVYKRIPSLFFLLLRVIPATFN